MAVGTKGQEFKFKVVTAVFTKCVQLEKSKLND